MGDDDADPTVMLQAPLEQAWRSGEADAARLARYQWAAALLDGRRALDAGCATGEGARLLAGDGAAGITGVDWREALVDAARAEYGDAASWAVADLSALPDDDGVYGVAVCFGPLDSAADPAALLAELRRVLAPDGLLLASVAAAGGAAERLQALLSERFANVALCEQSALLVSAVWPSGGARSIRDTARVAMVPDAEGAPQAVLALASDAPLPAAGPCWAAGGAGERTRVRERAAELDALARSARAAKERADSADRELRDVHAQLRAAEQAVAPVPELERRIKLLERDLVAARADFGRETARLRTMADERARAAEAVAEARRHIITGLQASLSWRLTRPLRALKRRLR